MTDIVNLVEALNDHDKAVAVQVLDAVSRPLQAREIEGMLRKVGVPKPRAVILASSLKRFSIIAVIGPEQ